MDGGGAGVTPIEPRVLKSAPPATPTAPPMAAPMVARRPPAQRRRSGGRAAWAAAVLILLAAAGLGHRYAWVREVVGVRVAAAPFAVELRGPGLLDATRKAAVAARIQGRLVEVAVDRNDRVAVGRIVARIQSEELESQHAAAVASQSAAARAVEEAEAERTRARAALTNLRAAFARQDALQARGWATPADIDASRAALGQGEAEVDRAEAGLRRAVAQNAAATATAQASRAQLDDTTIRAPFAGLVVARERNLGDVVAPGAAIIQLIDPASVVLTARFDESAIARIRPGQPAVLRFTSEPDRPVQGRVLRLGRTVDTETREFTADIVPDELPVNWAIGQRATAAVTVDTIPDAVAVPARLIVHRNGRPGVWVTDDGRARWRAIEPGPAGDERLAVIDGLSPGDAVLAPDGLYPWMPVRVREGGR